ncbi:MAG TPA: hypothetical protein VNO35_03045 [Steroidobacteraceae bacterium]|nr:hypothetical protein [Steroidobacteraceae bacterium]
MVIDVTQDAQRAHGADDSRLVVASAWPDTPVANHCVGSLRHRPMRENGVHVRDEQNMALTGSRQCGDNIIAHSGRYRRYALDVRTEMFQFRLRDRAHGGQASDITCAGINLHELLQECPRFRFASFSCRKDPGVRSGVGRRDGTDRQNRKGGRRKDSLSKGQSCGKHCVPLSPRYGIKRLFGLECNPYLSSTHWGGILESRLNSKSCWRVRRCSARPQRATLPNCTSRLTVQAVLVVFICAMLSNTADCAA